MMDIFKSQNKHINKKYSKKINELRVRYPQYDIGRGTYGTLEVLTWDEGATLTMGAFCSVAEGVKIFLGGEHRVDWATTYPFSYFWESGLNIPGHPKTKGDVIIGNDVWIGAEAVIMSGVQIGDGAVVGARAVVTKNIEPYAICVGNPARSVKKRFDEKTVQQLLELEWWNFTNQEIEQLLPLMLHTDIQAFINEAVRIKEINGTR